MSRETSKYSSPEHEGLPTHVEELRHGMDIHSFFLSLAQSYGMVSAEAREREAHYLTSHLSKNYLFGVRNEGEVIAGVELSIHERRGKRCGYVWHKFVLPAHEGQGLANTVDAAAEAKAKELGCAYIFSLVDRTRTRAVRAITLAGYTVSFSPAFQDLRAKFPEDDVYIKVL